MTRRCRLGVVLIAAAACAEPSRGGSSDHADASLVVDASVDAAAAGDADRFDNPRQPTIDAGGNAADAAMVDASWHGEVPEVCDGSKRIPLRLYIGPGASRPAPGQEIESPGYVWLITGECHYYALGTPNRWLEIFHGELTPEAAQEIGRRVHYGDPLDAPWDVSVSSQVSDANTVALDLGNVTTGCYADCAGAPPEVLNALDQAFAISQELVAAGALWNGPIRISSVERYGPPNASTPYYESAWPLSLAPELASVTEEVWNQGMYTGVLIEEQGDLDALRALKTDTKALNSMNMYGFLWIQATDTTHYEFRFRDAIPLENADGVIVRTW